MVLAGEEGEVWQRTVSDGLHTMIHTTTKNNKTTMISSISDQHTRQSPTNTHPHSRCGGEAVQV